MKVAHRSLTTKMYNEYSTEVHVDWFSSDDITSTFDQSINIIHV